MKYALIYGSQRESRLGIRCANFVKTKFEEKGHTVILVDAKEANLPVFDKKHSDYKESQAPQSLESMQKTFAEADGFILVAGEYNASLPPGLLNVLHHFTTEYHYKPSAIACYSAGPFGGVRGAMHLRTVLVELGMPPIPKTFPMMSIHNEFNEDGTTNNDKYHTFIEPFIAQLDWYAQALKAQREKGIPS